MGYNVEEFVKNSAREENYVGGLTPYVSEQGNLSIPFTFGKVEEKAGIKYLSRDAKEISRDGKIFIPTALFDTTTALGRSFKAAILSAFEQAPEALKKLAEQKTAKDLEKERDEKLSKELKSLDIEDQCNVINMYLEYKDAAPKFLETRFNKAKSKLFKLDKEKYYQYFPAEKVSQPANA